ncbi:MAG: dihydropteroate synthase, partial [Aquiluna sp.]
MTGWTRPLLMGVLNVTPDSFSDGGQFLEPARALEQASMLSAQGAEIIDVGGESTRPGAVRVTPAEEQARILPVIEA